jgi:diguanylate cyclase (GGDEF)-like protein
MALHDSFKTSASANIRLAKLSSIPELQDLSFAMAQASKHPQATIELPWKAAGSSTTFVLKISLSEGSEEGPRWTLHAGDNPDSAVLWSYDSKDTALIQSLISAESEPQRALNSYVDTSKKVDDSIWIKKPEPPAPPPVERTAPRINLPAPAELDRAALDYIQKAIRRMETGIISEAYFSWLTIQEFSRYQRAQVPFALIMFEMSLRLDDGTISLPPLRVLQEAANRVQSNCRPLDLLCHFKDPKLVIMLPHTGSNDAMLFANRIEELLRQSPLTPGLDQRNLVINFGIASIPDTCDHPGVVISAALEALEQGKRTNNSVVLFPSS